MATDEQVRQARERNDALRQQIAEKQASVRSEIEEANNEYRLQRYERERQELEAQLAALDRPVVSIPQPPDENAVFADTVQPEPPKETGKPPKSSAPSTPTDVATINPQGE